MDDLMDRRIVKTYEFPRICTVISEESLVKYMIELIEYRLPGVVCTREKEIEKKD